MRKGNSRQSGQALIEFALMIPLLFLLVVNVVNFGGLFSAWITVTHATRSAAQYAVTGPAYLGFGTTYGLQALPTSGQQIRDFLLTTCPNGDLCSLPNRPSIKVTVCTNNNAFGVTPTITCPVDESKFIDPEPATSVIATVDVSYRYCPLIPFWDFPALGIHSTLRPCSPTNDSSPVPVTGDKSGIWVHRTAAMRMIQ